MTDVDRLLTAGEVAELLNMSEDAVRRQTRAKVIPHVRIGRVVRYRRAAVLAWVESIEQGGAGGTFRKHRPQLQAAEQ